MVKSLVNKGLDIFLDLKIYDIPNTMAKTAVIITELGCWAFTVHLQVGEESLRVVQAAVSETAMKLNKRKPLILGVSVLTSSAAMPEEINVLVERAYSVGLKGVIASPYEVKEIKRQFRNLKVITPGIRNASDAKDDQRRITTAHAAFESGADYIVVGRPIIERENYLQAAKDIIEG